MAIMGQTGVGKSSLLNALFGAQLLIGDVRPTTKEPEPVTVQGSSGHPITFWDMPGIGESESVDRGYMLMYSQKLIECDVVLGAIHADSRSTVFDAAALRSLLGGLPEGERRAVTAKLTFVLTKSDILVPPPWIYVRDGATGSFTPSKSTQRRLDEKASYYQEQLLLLVVCIVNKLGESAIARFKRFADDPDALDTVPVSVMRKYGNLVVWDKRKRRVTFDLDDVLS